MHVREDTPLYLVGALVLAIGIPSVAAGFGEGRSLLLGKRNPSPNVRADARRREIIASTSTYGTRQSNKKDGDGGGAIYGCRSSHGQRALHPRQQPQGRARVRVRDRRQGGRPHRDRGRHRRAVHHQRDRRRHRPERRQGRRQGGADFAGAGRLAVRRRQRATARSCRRPRGDRRGASTDAAAQTYTVTFGRDVSKCSYTATSPGNSADSRSASRPARPRTRSGRPARRRRQRGAPVPAAGDLLS